MTRSDSPVNMAHSVHDRLMALAKGGQMDVRLG